MYFANVKHWAHAVAAMEAVFDSAVAGVPWAPSPTMVRRARRIPGVGESVSGILNRRSTPDSWFRAVEFAGIGPSQFFPPLTDRLPFSISRASVARTTSNCQARRLRTMARRHEIDVLQFMEGTGYKMLREGSGARVNIMERRGLHHGVFEREMHLHLGFPPQMGRDVIADRLEQEYATSDLIVTYSENARRTFVEHGVPPEKLRVVPLSVAVESEPPAGARDRDSRHLLFVGRGDELKGLDLAVAIVCALKTPYRLTVAGPASPEVIGWLRQWDQVDYRGVLSRDELQALYASAGVMLAPSTESFGLAAVEALTAGMPVFALPSTGIIPTLGHASVVVVNDRRLETWLDALGAWIEGEGVSAEPESVRLPTFSDSIAAQVEVFREAVNR